MPVDLLLKVGKIKGTNSTLLPLKMNVIIYNYFQNHFVTKASLYIVSGHCKDALSKRSESFERRERKKVAQELLSAANDEDLCHGPTATLKKQERTILANDEIRKVTDIQESEIVTKKEFLRVQTELQQQINELKIQLQEEKDRNGKSSVQEKS